MGGGGNPPTGGLWPVAQLPSTCCAPGALPGLQVRRREDNGRAAERGVSASARLLLPSRCVCHLVPPAAAWSGCHLSHRISSHVGAGGGHCLTHLHFAPDAVSGVSQGRRPGCGAGSASGDPASSASIWGLKRLRPVLSRCPAQPPAPVSCELGSGVEAAWSPGAPRGAAPHTLSSTPGPGVRHTVAST